jgi:hypothetical protein
VLLLHRSDTTPKDVPIVPTPAGGGATVTDPFAWDPSRAAQFTQRAAAGNAHGLYTLSPGGAAATAARTARWRPQIDQAARAAGVSPDTLEGLVFLESAGRPDAMTPEGLSGAVGLMQILAETGRSLLGMHVDLKASAKLTARIDTERHRGHQAKVDALVKRRMQVDQRFDPQASLMAAARYLTLARKRFGREDLAFESYHMGMGNLESVLRAYTGDTATPTADLVANDQLSWVKVYFDSTPANHPAAWHKLFTFGDDSQNYYWKLLGAAQIMHLYRTDRGQLTRLAALQTDKASAEEVLHPADATPQFSGPGQLRTAWADGDIVALPDQPGRTGLAREPSMGQFAQQAGSQPALYHGLRPAALAMAYYIGAQVRSMSGVSPLTVTSTVRDQDYQRVLSSHDIEATHKYSLHTTGWAFDIGRVYVNNRQSLAFQSVLDRLQSLNVIAWVREPKAIHITVSSDAKVLLGLLKR